MKVSLDVIQALAYHWTNVVMKWKIVKTKVMKLIAIWSQFQTHCIEKSIPQLMTQAKRQMCL